jgi:hypothetical protein
MEYVIDRDTATKEVNAWLDYKRIQASYRDKRKDSIEVLVDGIMSGNVSIADGEYMYGKDKLQGPMIKQTLAFPTGSLTELTYKPRETTGNLSASLRNGINTPVASCYGSILSNGVMPAQIETMDSEDSRVLQAIVSFFL